jgi:lysophospholipase L1-like esterase
MTDLVNYAGKNFQADELFAQASGSPVNVRLWRPSGRYAAIGDSIIQGNADLTNNVLGDTTWFHLACVLSNQRIQYVRNAGIAGQNTTQWAARVASDVIAYAPSRCFVPVGSPNDSASSISFATTKANITSIVNALLNAGILPTLISMVPFNTPAYLSTISSLNAWGSKYAAQQGLDYINTHRYLVDATTGQYNAAFTADGTHPNRAGARTIAAAVVAALGNYLPVRTPFIPDYSVGGSANLVPGGAFAVDTNADGIADNWIVYGGVTSGSVTPSLVTDSSATGVSGKWQQLVAAGPFVGTRILETAATFGTLGTNFAIGDRVAFSGRIQTSGCEAGSCIYSVRLLFNGGASTSWLRPLDAAQIDIADGTFYSEGVIPAGTTNMTIDVVMSGGAGTVKVGQIGVINLTALGF